MMDNEDMKDVEILKEAVWQSFLANLGPGGLNESAGYLVSQYGFTGPFAGLENHGIKDELDLYRKVSLALGED